MSFILRRTQNTMKKSKIIVPALGLLLLSTAASVSGTVAWFTAVRTYNMTAGEFAVVKTTATLECELGAGVGTTANSSAKSIGLASENIELTDASFDHVNNKIIAPDADGAKIGKVTDLVTATSGASFTDFQTAITRAVYEDSSSVEHTVYSAATWTMDFKIAFTAGGVNSALFLNSTSKFTDSTGNEIVPGEDGEAGKGFRIAFVPITDTGDSTNVFQTGSLTVYAGAQKSDTGDFNVTPTYVTNAAVGTTLAGASYTGTTLMDRSYTTGLPNDGAANTTTASARNDYLGKFTAVAGSTVHLKFYCVAWFEGTDPNVNNNADLNNVKAALNFELRTLSD